MFKSSNSRRKIFSLCCLTCKIQLCIIYLLPKCTHFNMKIPQRTNSFLFLHCQNVFFFFSLYSFETSIKFNIVRTSARIFCGYLIYMCLLIYSCFFLYSSSFQTNFPFLCSAEFASLSQSSKKTERYGLIRLQLY